VIKGLHHIGVAVRSLEERAALYRGLGLEVAESEEVPTEMVRVAVLPVGDTRVELLEATSPESPVARFIADHGEGVHHICLEVDDLRATMARLAAGGFRLISEEPRPGAHGTRVCFVHPKSTGGVLIELCQTGG
jgi:methylmalonyl-CoA/ethylmalonyl-CoA epimerase